MTKVFNFAAVAAALFTLFSCNSTQENKMELSTGIWHAEIATQGKTIPFNFEVKQLENKQYELVLINADERISLKEYTLSNDTVIIPMHIFDAEIRAKVISANELSGVWTKNYVADYILPFSAKAANSNRFETQSVPTTDFSGKWDVSFIKPDKTSKAVGIFKQTVAKAEGTFMTATGDYRYLEGVVDGNQIKLSVFDGEHAYLFEGTLQGDSISGEYWSGLAGYQKWTAKRNENAALPDANSLTFLKEGYDKVAFEFPAIKGGTISLDQEKYQGKVVLVQIFGTWCPNCMDETAFLSEWYRKNKARGVEIVGLAFERKDDFAYAQTRVNKVIERFDVEYDFAFAGISDNQKAAEALPMLNHVMSFPTTIFINREGKVVNIHTGFSGPGTGVYYEQFVTEFNGLMDKLIEEK